jgi:hypothetical protein
MKYFTSGAAIVLVLCTTSCMSSRIPPGHVPDPEEASEKHTLRAYPLNPSRKVSAQNCYEPINTDGGNLLCR